VQCAALLAGSSTSHRDAMRTVARCQSTAGSSGRGGGHACVVQLTRATLGSWDAARATFLRGGAAAAHAGLSADHRGRLLQDFKKMRLYCVF
jgi:hypothetical protein